MSQRGEVVRLLREIQTLALELAAEERETGAEELEGKKRALEQLRWRLAAASRRTAHGDLGNAA
jgi:hypothetical protein